MKISFNLNKDWLKKINFEDSLKVNVPFRNERIQNLVSSNYMTSRPSSKESDSFIFKTDSLNAVNYCHIGCTDNNRNHNNIIETSKQTQLNKSETIFSKVSLIVLIVVKKFVNQLKFTIF